jgi:23S rRNA (cytidine1920-2'-O)/16S rRNA (cytidine1409-2'-O)-methyltransferase
VRTAALCLTPPLGSEGYNERPPRRVRPVRRVPLLAELKRVRPDVDDPAGAIASGRVIVDGVSVTNPDSRVPVGCSIVVGESKDLRGSVKLRAALERFGVSVDGRIALDIGAAAGGFTTALLECGAKRVYAVDAGHGELLGSLRQDPRVVNLEATNVGDLTQALVPERVGVVTIDVSYLSLASAVDQLGGVGLAPDADLIGLVKPMFELRLANAPTDAESLEEAMSNASVSIDANGWTVNGVMQSPVRGSKGAIEGFIYAVARR